MKDGCAVRMLKNQRSASGVFLGHFSLPLPPSASLLSFPSSFFPSGVSVAFALQTPRCPFPACVPPVLCWPWRIRQRGQWKQIKRKLQKGVRSFDSPKPCLLSCFRGVAWVCVISGQNVFLTRNDQHECVSVSIDSAEVTCHGWFMSLFCHVSLQAGQRASGWMGSANLPIYYSCQLWKGFFFPPYLMKGPSAMNQWSEDDSWFVNLDSVKWLGFGGLHR